MAELGLDQGFLKPHPCISAGPSPGVLAAPVVLGLVCWVTGARKVGFALSELPCGEGLCFPGSTASECSSS